MPPPTIREELSANSLRSCKLPVTIRPTDSAKNMQNRRELLVQVTSPLLKGQATVAAPISVESLAKHHLQPLAAPRIAHSSVNKGKGQIVETGNESLLTELMPSPLTESNTPQLDKTE